MNYSIMPASPITPVLEIYEDVYSYHLAFFYGLGAAGSWFTV
jgi:hypothetical protein